MGDEDKVQNKIQEAQGKAKEEIGKATGDKSTEAEGRNEQATADLKNAGEKVKDAFRH